jgi:hypothetical protein
MAFYSWRVEYDGTTDLDNVQSIVVNRGRVQVQDPFKAATATVTGRDLSTLPNIEIGAEIYIEASRGIDVFNVFHGVVSDVQITYGQVAAMDTWTIYCEDVLARLGRGLTPVGAGWSAGSTGLNAAASVLGQAFGGAITITGTNTGSLMSAQTINNANVLQVLNQIAATEQGYIYGFSPSQVVWVPRSEYGAFPFLGTITDNVAAVFPPYALFDSVIFRSQADSFFDEVVVEPEGLASQTAGTGPRVYSFKSYDETTAQASNLAAYVLSTLQVQQSVPSSISAISEVQNSDVMMNAAWRAGTGVRLNLRLRGVLQKLFVEGSTITATPEQTRFTLNVVSAAALNFLVLDSTALGVLDEDKLGF